MSKSTVQGGSISHDVIHMSHSTLLDLDTASMRQCFEFQCHHKSHKKNLLANESGV